MPARPRIRRRRPQPLLLGAATAAAALVLVLGLLASPVVGSAAAAPAAASASPSSLAPAGGGGGGGGMDGGSGCSSDWRRQRRRLLLRPREENAMLPLLLARARGGASSTQASKTEQDAAKRHPHRNPLVGGKHGAAAAGGHKKEAGPGKQEGKGEEIPSQLTFKSPTPALKWLGGGAFHRTEWDHNGRAHYERRLTQEEARLAVEGATGQPLPAASTTTTEEPLPRVVHLYWHPPSSQWVLHLDLDPALNYDHYLGYCKINAPDVGQTDRAWLLRTHKKWQPIPTLRLAIPGRAPPDAKAEAKAEAEARRALAAGVAMPPRLIPVFISFFLDAVGTGLASPILPFYIMGLGANAFQLGLVLAFNYAAQTVGCIVMGNVSDRYGRRPVMLCCLAASFCSLSVVARAKTLPQVALGRVIGGMFGGFVPLAQSAVADLCPVEGRAKFLGRIQACMGAGFVAGPALSLLGSRVYGLDTRGVLKRAALLPALAFTFGLLFIKETKDPAPSLSHPSGASTASTATTATTLDLPSSTQKKKGGWALPPLPVRLLVLNGFLLMYAFSVETVYAMFIKDNFGFEETALGMVFALNGIAVGVLQVFFIKNLFARLGKHVMLALGNILLAAGMVGLSLVRSQMWLHFALFSIHIVGYAISDTALASLISRYSSPDSQGKNLGWSHAAQSCARIISPLVAGTLYELSKAPGHPLPPGALPYIAGSAMPLLGVMVPTVLYLRSIEAKRAAANGGVADK